jgi:hypothetical protein
MIRQARQGMLAQFLRCDWTTAFQHHGCGHILAQGGMRHGKCDRLRHRRVLQENLVHLAGCNFFAAAVDHLFQASGDEQVTVGVEIALVAGAEPAICKRIRVGLRAVDIATITFGPRMVISPVCSALPPRRQG